MKTISIINLKGGVAKTLSAVNMAHILAAVHNKRVLLDEIIAPTRYENLDLIPANMNLLRANLAVMVDNTRQRETRFKKAFRAISGEYDFCIIDNAPDINISTINALVASDDVLIPIKIDKFAFDGLAELREQIDNTREDLNPALGLLRDLLSAQRRKRAGRGMASYTAGFPDFRNAYPPHGKGGRKHICRGPHNRVFAPVRGRYGLSAIRQ